MDLGGSNFSAFYLEKDLDMECYGTTHLSFLFGVAVPSFIIWGNNREYFNFQGFGTPYLAYRYLKKNKAQFQVVEFKAKFGFLYYGYKEKLFYW